MGRTVLFISPSPEDGQLLASMLAPLEFKLKVAETLADTYAGLNDPELGVVLTESRLPDADWHAVLLAVREHEPTTQILVTAPHADAHFWTDALEAGAYDIVTQPFYTAEVQRLVLSAWLKFETVRLARMRKGPAKVTSIFAAQAVG